ncbi:Alpha/Beta hydrolase protein [Aspergillus cavernicola]|uniref:Alpha/Beta hydrolase protein n=1 Tax=Aspergillus cavernicola TaxID=176166 RepID=A0ABR4IXV5_9EURO
MDFSEYTGPSKEWLVLEPALPTRTPGLTTEELKAITNKGREDVAARDMMEQDLSSRVIIHDHRIPTRDNQTLEARSYRPSNTNNTNPSKPLPVYIHLHGGGFLFGTLASEDAICSRIVTSLAEQENTPIVVLNVNYRHTPEHAYPVAWNDTEDAFHWVHDHLGEIGGDGERVVMGGISAGAWLAASTALAQNLARDGELAARPRIRGMVLMIPGLVHYKCYRAQVERLRDPGVSSWVENRDAPVIPLKTVEMFMGLLGVEGGEGLEGDLRLNPGNARGEQVAGLGPVTVGVAGMDPLRDEGLLFAQLLSENGVPTRTNVFRGVPHGFRRFGEKLSVCEKWDAVMVEGIKWALRDAVPGPFEIHAF